MLGPRRDVPLVVFMLVLVLVSCGPAHRVSSEQLDNAPRLAVMSAFEPELTQLLKIADVTASYVMNGRTVHVGTLAGNDVVMTLSGISMTNAAMTTQVLLDHFDVTGIVFSGIAGGVNPDLYIGDVVVAARWGQYQEQLAARQTAGGWDLGWHSEEFGNFGMMFPQFVHITRDDGRTDDTESRFWFAVDEEMMSIAQRAARSVDLDSCTSRNVCLSHDPKVVLGGNGVSGSTFVDNAEYREWIWATFQADAVDMESAAVAHVAYVNGVPCIAFRSLSDLAGGGPGENELSTFYDLAADNSARVVIRFLELWAADH